MQDWIETTNPPGIWVWGSDGGGWTWYPPVDKTPSEAEVKAGVLDDFEQAFKSV